ncbi:MmcQ/YjbR family DNA-binding protein [Zafaria sp. Z1313]|uniref:MmcQ/YjbR family DNA-binding protein n=1 Tax=unclassified Zafaria TaxID=2828765 RepID=UPI002E7A963D|nr:MmcQ/YjbR family DNA-binding protein [Zafaria sp. J156]MEE1621745.1 MmcQ/YjbR family DNA-binding protein [Zafaria sp. J156]
MDYKTLRDACLALPGAFEDFPFGPDTAVIKVRGRADGPVKMFALLWPREDGAVVNLKCEPALAVQLRGAHPEITPGYHMSKKHWNTVDCTGVGSPGATLTGRDVLDLVEDSYDLVVEKLPAPCRAALGFRRDAGL